MNLALVLSCWGTCRGFAGGTDQRSRFFLLPDSQPFLPALWELPHL